LSAYLDRRGALWVETTGGIDRLENDRFAAVSKTSNAAVDVGGFGFGENQSGALFAFGPATGTFRIEENRAIKLNGAPRITGMVKSPGNLWFCGNGIYRTSPDSLEKWEYARDTPPDYTRFDRADGMTSAECSGGSRNMAITNDRRLWVPTEQGVAMLEISRLRHFDRKPAIYMEQVVIGKASRAPGRELILPAGTQHVELHFDSIELASPEAIRMQYRLDGVDREWLYADPSAAAIYSGIPAGTHAFHVRASNSDGVWDPAGIVYNVTQEPFYYETMLFRVSSLGVFGLFLAGAYRLRLGRITAQMNARLDDRVAERTRFARDLHDTMLQTIQGSEMIVSVAMNQPGNPAHTDAALARLSAGLARAREEARACLQSLRASTTQVNDLAEALLHTGEESAAGYPLKFNLLVEGAVKDMHPIVRDEILRIGAEAIRNACIHSAGSKVEVVLIYAHSLELRVRDDGKGIGAETIAQGKPGHFGLAGMQERAARIGGKLTVRSSAKAGTQVELAVPGRIAFREKQID
jgi:signal transduction histidine kinase